MEMPINPHLRAAKIVAVVLKALGGDAKACVISTASGLSESKISRLKNEHLPDVATLLAFAGLKVVPLDSVCVSKDRFDAITVIAQAAMSNVHNTRNLIWEDQE